MIERKPRPQNVLCHVAAASTQARQSENGDHRTTRNPATTSVPLRWRWSSNNHGQTVRPSENDPVLPKSATLAFSACPLSLHVRECSQADTLYTQQTENGLGVLGSIRLQCVRNGAAERRFASAAIIASLWIQCCTYHTPESSGCSQM